MVVQRVAHLLQPNLLELLASPWLLRQPLLLPQLVPLTLQVARENENAKMANGMITAIDPYGPFFHQYKILTKKINISEES